MIQFILLLLQGSILIINWYTIRDRILPILYSIHQCLIPFRFIVVWVYVGGGIIDNLLKEIGILQKRTHLVHLLLNQVVDYIYGSQQHGSIY